MHSLYKAILLSFLLTFLAPLSPLAAWSAQSLELESSTLHSTNGGFNLTWELPDNIQSENNRIELQQSRNNHSDFKTIYTGTDSATVITGLSDGEYLYRARLLSGKNQMTAWSDPVSIQVEHHSLSKAFAFFIVGAMVFVGTVLLILLVGRMKTPGDNA